MKQQTDTLVDDLNHDATERLDPTAMRRAERTTPDSSAVANKVQHVTSNAKPSLGERIKGLLLNFTKALEGDHDFHNYLGG